MAKRTTPTQSRLRALLAYDPETGAFTWRVSRGRMCAGMVAGGRYSNGYQRIRVDGEEYLAHRLVWLYTDGAWPAAEIDHINGDRSDNRRANLRLAAGWQNHANARLSKRNTSGFKGVSFDKRRGLWYAYIKKHGRMLNLGLYKTAEAAHAARLAKAKELFGDFARAR